MRSMRLGTMLALLALAGTAGATCSENALCPPTPPPPDPNVCVVMGTHTISDGCSLDFGTIGLIVHNNAKVQAADGDDVSITAGSITVRGTAQARGGRLSLKAVGGNANDANTGAIRTESVSNSPGKIDVRDGGVVVMDASAGVHLLGQDVNADGGTADHGGMILATSGGAVTATSAIHANGTTGGDGGIIRLEGPGNVHLQGPVEAAGDGASSGQVPGDGGAITIRAGGTLELDQEVLAYGELGGDGGEVALASAGAMTLDHNVNASGTGGTAGGEGGLIDIAMGSGTISGALTATATSGSRGGRIRLVGRTGNVTAASGSSLDVSGGGNGGEGGTVDVRGVGNVTVNGTITANAAGTSSAGGEVAVYARGTLTIGAAIEAKSTSSGAQDGAMIDLAACAIVVNGHLKTRNASGTGQTRLRYVTSLTGSGVSILADDPEGNQITCACTDGNADGVCDASTCASAPSFTGVTLTPSPTYGYEPLTCG